MKVTVYLSGEIHTDWRNEIKDGAQKYGLDIEFISAVTDHDASDSAGDVLGPEDSSFWRDHKFCLYRGRPAPPASSKR